MKEIVSKFLEIDYDKYVTMRTFKITVLNEHNEEVEFNEHRYVAKYDLGTPLLSPTRILGLINPPKPFLYQKEGFKKAGDFGREFGSLVEEIVNNKTKPKTKNKVMSTLLVNVFNEFKQRKGKPLRAEKHILKDLFHGFVDLYCEDENGNLIIVEFKTRKTENDVLSKDFFQLGYYKGITEKLLEEFDHNKEYKFNLDCYVVVGSRETGKMRFFKLHQKQAQLPQQTIEMCKLLNQVK